MIAKKQLVEEKEFDSQQPRSARCFGIWRQLKKMEPPTIPSDADLHEAAQAFAEIIFGSSTLDPKVKALFIEDFEMGAKWMRRKMREAYEIPPRPATRRKKQLAQ